MSQLGQGHQKPIMPKPVQVQDTHLIVLVKQEQKGIVSVCMCLSPLWSTFDLAQFSYLSS